MMVLRQNGADIRVVPVCLPICHLDAKASGSSRLFCGSQTGPTGRALVKTNEREWAAGLASSNTNIGSPIRLV
jgi:hypothetical protein